MAPETGLIMFNARQSRWPEDKMAEEDQELVAEETSEVLICWGAKKPVKFSLALTVPDSTA